MVVALELVFARVPIASAITKARDDRIAAVEEHLAFELGVASNSGTIPPSDGAPSVPGAPASRTVPGEPSAGPPSMLGGLLPVPPAPPAPAAPPEPPAPDFPRSCRWFPK
jgi:hypothetical protein